LIDVTPPAPPGRQLVQGYGDGAFRVSGRTHKGSILVFADETRPWPVADMASVTIDALAPVLARAGSVDLLLLGSGLRLLRPGGEVARGLRAAGVALEVMDTGAACRTYNVLTAEDRRVAAALIAV